jgi:ABC-2 type transport system permease protein
MILSVVRAGWMNLRRDRAAFMFSFIVPIVFFSIFASIFGGSRSSTSSVKVIVVDDDHSHRSAQVMTALRNESALKVSERPETAEGKPLAPLYTAATAEQAVRHGDISVALIIPKGLAQAKVTFGAANAASAPVFRVIADTSDPIAPQVVTGLLQKNVFLSMPDMMMSGAKDAFGRVAGGLTPQQSSSIDGWITRIDNEPAATPATGAAAKKRNDSAFDSIMRIETKDVLGATKRSPLIAFYAAGIGVMFLLFTATNGGGALLEERESGTLDRILSTHLTLNQLLLGKLAYLWTLGVVQLIVMFIWGALVFKLDLLGHLPGFAIMTAFTALACSAFGLLIASASRTRAQLSAISTLTVLSISAMGGSMFPKFLMPDIFQKIGLALFNSWAIDGFTKVFWREEPLRALLPSLAVLLGSAIVFFALARRLTRQWELS